MKNVYLAVDSRNRICLTKLSKQLPARFLAYLKDGKIILEPLVEIPQDEAWLFEPKNKKILAQVKKGLSQIKTKKLVSHGSFAKYRK